MYFLESPHHTPLINCKDQFNWTATYRWDSDLVIPYEHWEYYDQNVKSQPQSINYAANKTKKVSEWKISNNFLDQLKKLRIS